MREQTTKSGKLRGKVVVKDGKYFFLSRDGERYFIKQNDLAKRLAYSREICMFEPKKGDNISSDIMGEITDIIGKEDEPLSELKALVMERNLDIPFTNSALKEVEALPDEVTKDDWKDYRDMRDKAFVSIDPDSAGDFDDIICVEKGSDGTSKIYIGIALVANYVKRGSRLFAEAEKRTASAYIGNKVYPMLPEKLSNHLCSLNEGVDRLAMVVSASIDSEGKITEWGIEPAVVNSRHRLRYKDADYIHFGHCDTVKDQSEFAGLSAKTIDVKSSIDAFYELSQNLYADRMRRGAIDINSKVPNFVLDEDGTKVKDIEQEQGEKFTKAIESAMILNNMIYGELGERLQLPMIYRNHTLPSLDDAKMLSDRLANLGIGLSPYAKAEDYSRAFKFYKDKPYEELANSLTLKAFKNAYYSTENLGQFGLGIKPMDETTMYIAKKHDPRSPRQVSDDARMEYFKETGSMFGLKFKGGLSNSAYAYASSPIRDLTANTNQLQMLNYIIQDKVLFSASDMQAIAEMCNEGNANIDMADKEAGKILSTVWAKDNLGKVVTARVVNFYDDGVLVKTDDNVSITIPWRELKDKIKPSVVSKMVEMCGNGKSNGKLAMNILRSPIKLGEKMKVKIYDTSSKPARIYASEDLSRELGYKGKGKDNEMTM